MQARRAVGGLAGVLMVGGLFLVGLAAKERDDRFCISCHLHEAKFARMTAMVHADLAGLHGGRKDVRCIDCHGGADPIMRVRVWTVAGVDTLRFLVGRYAEPRAMRLPLRSSECAQCHTPVRRARRELAVEHDESMGGSGGDSYHAIWAHDAVTVPCARCHASHTADSEAGRQFIARDRVRPICAECHAEMAGREGEPLRVSRREPGRE